MTVIKNKGSTPWPGERKLVNAPSFDRRPLVADGKPIPLPVFCSGRWHTILVAGRGALVACDHQNTDAADAARALGDEPIPCLRLLGALRSGDRAQIKAAIEGTEKAAPYTLSAFYGAVLGRKNLRGMVPDYFDRPLADRIAARSKSKLAAAFRSCGYADEGNFVFAFVTDRSYMGSITTDTRRRGGWGNQTFELNVRVTVQLHNWLKLDRAGLATVDKRIVLHDFGVQPNRLRLVLAGFQPENGLKVTARRAYVVRDDAGVPHLQWTRTPKGG